MAAKFDSQLSVLNLFAYLSSSHTYDLKHKYSTDMLNGLGARSGIPAHLRISVLFNNLCIAMPHIFILLFCPYNPFLQILQIYCV